jgi:MFS family permease
MFFLQNFSGAVCISEYPFAKVLPTKFSWSRAPAELPLDYYSPTLFAGIGISDTSLYTGVYGLLKAAGCIFFFAVIVDRSGRRIPWLVSASSCAACLLYLAIYTKIGHPQTGNISESTKQGGTAATVMIMLYAVLCVPDDPTTCFHRTDLDHPLTTLFLLLDPSDRCIPYRVVMSLTLA